MEDKQKTAVNSTSNLQTGNDDFGTSFRQAEEYPNGVLLGYTIPTEITLVSNEKFKKQKRSKNKLNLGF